MRSRSARARYHIAWGRRCTVGALREEAKDVDLTLMSGMGGTAAVEETRIVTAGDIVQQLADAFVE